MSAMDVFKAKSIPEALYVGKSEREMNALARWLDPEFKAPPSASVEIKFYKPVGREGKKPGEPGMFLEINTGTRGTVFHRLNDGDKITDEGKTLLVTLLTSLGNGAADLLDTIA